VGHTAGLTCDINHQGRRTFLGKGAALIAAGAAVLVRSATARGDTHGAPAGSGDDATISGSPQVGWISSATSTSAGGDPAWIDPSDLRFDKGLAVTEPVSSGALQAEHAFTLVPRNAGTLGFPVPVFRPTTGNVPLALDIQPNGVGLSSNNGYCWLDACDADTTGSPSGTDSNHAVNTARLAAQTDHTSVGGASVGGATPKPFWIRVPTTGDGATTPIIKLSPARGGVASKNGYTLTQDASVILNAAGGSVVASSGYQLASGTPHGFLYVPQVAAAPTGTPDSYGASNALCYVQGAKQLKVYDASLSRWATFVGS
jgi:hypothetical protein